MMRSRYFFFILFSSLAYSASFAQDTLPKFSVNNLGNNRIVIGWVNPYPQLKQISIQRSFDSLINYKTILSVTDPNAIQNGFADTKAPNDRMFYRLFVVPENGVYFFTPSKRPFKDTTVAKTAVVVQDVTTKDSAVTNVPVVVVKRPEYIPSVYVYTNSQGYVFINLPDADQTKYRLKFFDADGSLLFEIKKIEETALTLDKSNFIHAGWFNFELYKDDKLFEKHKFYLAKDF